MIVKRLFAFSFVAVLLAALGCDTGTPRNRTGGIVGPPPNADILACILLGVENGDALFCTGETVTLLGFNFPDDLSNVRVTFTTGDASVEGMPLRVVNQRRDINSRTVESSLEILIPAGVSTGIVELFCHGISAGAVGFDSCPVVHVVTLGANADFEFLFYFPNLGFQQGGSRVTVYGLNLSDAQEVVLDDGRGNTARIPSSTFIRNQVAGNFPGQLPTGYESFSFDLNGNGNNVQFPFQLERENLGMRVRSPSGQSNRVEVPVSIDISNSQRAPL